MKNKNKLKFSEKILDNILNIGYNIKIYFGRNTMANAKNYTEEMVSEMTTAYTENPTRETVDALAQQFGKTTRSIIAKLSREGVYIAKPRTTKTGEPIVRKAELLQAIETHYGKSFLP